jgi:putative tryptophan/tyrosine transport system substrate-binding protein
MVPVRRRDFIKLTSCFAASWPLAAHAQQTGRIRRIGVLMAHAESDPEFHAYLAAFREGLQKLGWTEGRNIRIDSRWGALDDAEARQRSAKELVELQPEIILTQNTPPTASMLQQTRTIPVVFAVVADPVGSGFVQNLARPGGNATGFTIMEPTTMGKWLELLKEVAPRTNRAALLFNPATTPYASIYLDPFKAAAASLGLESSAATVHDRAEFDTVIAAQAREPNGGLIVMPDGFLNVHRAEIILLAARYHLPAVYPWRFFAEQGGLLSYGSEQGDLFRQAATYVDRILKGEKPADLPVQAPTEYRLVINLKTAKALGLTVPLTLLDRADKVIE